MASIQERMQLSKYMTVENIEKVVDLSDQWALTAEKLNRVNEGLYTAADMQDMVYQSAQRSGSAYEKMAEAVSKLGSENVTSNGGEASAFAEQIRKQFALAGAEKVDASMVNLANALSDGILSGEEYKEVLGEAPNIVQSIADYMSLPQAQLQSMAETGKISAEIVKSAMFAAAEETNAEFARLPQTFSQIWTIFKNAALTAFSPVLQKMSEIASSEGFQTVVGSIVNGISIIGGAVSGIVDVLSGIADVVINSWSMIEPVLWGIITALGFYSFALEAYNAVQKISNMLTGIASFKNKVHAASAMMESGATFAATAAQHGFNAALLACPITWIILMVIALVAAFYAVVAAVNHFAGTSISATGVICGAFMAAAAFIGNLFLGLYNSGVDVLTAIWNFIAAFANFFANVFRDPIGAVARLFFDLVDGAISLLQTLATAMDTIFGSNLSGTLQGWRDELSGWVENKFDKGEEIMEKVKAGDYYLDRIKYSDAYNKGYNFGEGIEDKLSSLGKFGEGDIPKVEEYQNYQSSLLDSENAAQTAANTGNTAQNTANMADAMEISSEDLKYIRDMAEQDYINRFTTAEIVVNQTNNNTIKGKMDLDGITEHLRTALENQMNMTAEGVH